MTITSLSDNTFSAADNTALFSAALTAYQGTHPGATAIVLNPGASLSFDFDPTGLLVLDAGETHTNTVTVVAEDDDGATDDDTDDHTITAVDVPPAIEVTKTPSVASVPETGGDVTFTFTVKNTSTVDVVTITSLTDSVYGDLSDESSLIGTTLNVGQTATFTITRWVEGDFSGPDHVDTFTATAVDNDGSTATDDDDATVDFSNVLPLIEVAKTPGVDSVPETGGDVTFTFTIKITSTEEPVIITSVSDSDFTFSADEIAGVVGTLLAVGGSTEFSITRWVEGDFSGPDHVDTFTVTAEDNDGSTATDDDDATVDFSNVLPTITVVKMVDADEDSVFDESPESVQEGGIGDQKVDYKYVVTNTNSLGGESVTLDRVFDTTLGQDLLLASSITLNPGQSYTFTLNDVIVPIQNAGTSYVDTMEAQGYDNDGSHSNRATDTATVTYTNVNPSIDIQKTVDAKKDSLFNDAEALTTVDGKAIYVSIRGNEHQHCLDRQRAVAHLPGG